MQNILIALLLTVTGSLVIIIFFQKTALFSFHALKLSAKNDIVTVSQDRTTYYIDSSLGNNLSKGTDETLAWKDFSNIQKTVFNPGDRIRLKRGQIWYQTLTISQGGTAELPLQFDAYGTGLPPTIDVRNQFNRGIYINSSNVALSDLVVKNARKNGIAAMSSESGIKNITLTDVTIRNSGLNGIGIGGGGNDIHIIRCTIEHSGNNGIALLGSLENKLSRVLVSDCRISYVKSNDGITIHADGKGYSAGSDFIIQNTVAEFCGEEGFDITTGENILLFNNLSRQNINGGVLVGHQAQNVSIVGHISIDEPTKNKSAAINFNGGPGNIRLMNSLLKGNGYHLIKIKTSDVAIFNNTFIWDGGSAPIDIAGKIENLFFFNNIISSKQNRMSRIRFLEPTRPPDHKSFYFDFNIYHVPSGQARIYHDGKNYFLNQYKERFNADQHSLDLDPLFMDPFSDNYHLQARSPAISAGRFMALAEPTENQSQIWVDQSLFFYNSLFPETRQEIKLEGSPEISRVIDVDFSAKLLTLAIPLNFNGQTSIELFNSMDIGAYEYIPIPSD